MKTATVAASVTRRAGGLFDSLLGTCRELSKLRGVRESVLSLDDGAAPEDLARWTEVSPDRFPVFGPSSFGYSPGLRRTLLAGEYDLVHTHGLWQYPSVAVTAWHRKTRRPHLVSPHGMLDPWAVRNSAWKKRVARWLYEDDHLRNAACIRALCDSEAQSIRAFGLKNPIAIIPNGIDLPTLENTETLKTETLTTTRDISASQHFSISDFAASGRKTLLYLGRIHPKKGLVNLLRAWASVQHADGGVLATEWILAIAGWDQGGHEAELKQLATELGIPWMDAREHSTFNIQHPTLNSRGGSEQDEVSLPGIRKSEIVNRNSSEPSILHPPSSQPPSLLFLGPQFGEAKAACYRACDAFILPSYSEGLPMAVLEAWAYAKPVLMTPECNLPEGFAANAAIRIEANPESIAQGLRDLFDLSSRPISASQLSEFQLLESAPRSALRGIGDNGRFLVASRFTWPKIARDMKSVYDWVLGGGTKPTCVRGD